MKKIAIIGAGPGGLAAGMILARLGHQVTIFEKDASPGGRSQGLHLGNFHFDTGPTFFMFKEVLEEVFRESGYQLEDEIDFIPIDPLYRLVFPKVTWEPRMDENSNVAMYDSFQVGLGIAYRRWKTIQADKLSVIQPLLKRPFRSILDFVRWDTLQALPRLHPLQSVYTSLKQLSNTPEFIHSLSFQAKYLGMASFNAPSAFTFLPFLEHQMGLYHVTGGLNKIHHKMAELFVKSGGTIQYQTPVEQILVSKNHATGVRIRGQDQYYDAIVVNADFSYVMTRLINPMHLKKYHPRQLAKKQYSVSTINIYLGLDCVLDFAHHQIVFSHDYDTYLKDLMAGRFTDDLSYYIHNPVVSDLTMAPSGQSALYILAPVPNLRSQQEWSSYQVEVENKIYDSIHARFGIDLRPHILTKRIITPQTWEDDYNVHIGAVFNLSHSLNQMMHRRPHNQFEEIRNLYLVGGGTHPGSGLPTIYQSALLLKPYFTRKDH